MEPDKLENLCLFNSDKNLWKSCQYVNLITNFRLNDKNWNATLNRIRFGRQNKEDIELLKSRYVSNFKDINFDTALHTFYTNKQVFAHNYKMIRKLPGKLEVIQAELPNRKRRSTSEHGTIDATNFSFNLELKIGAQVMLIHNIDILDGLVNGVNGKIIDFVYRTMEKKLTIYAVIVKFDDDDIGSQWRKKYSEIHPSINNFNGVPIFKVRREYKSQRRASSMK